MMMSPASSWVISAFGAHRGDEVVGIGGALHLGAVNGGVGDLRVRVRERVAHRLDAAVGIGVGQLGAFPGEYADNLFNFHFIFDLGRVNPAAAPVKPSPDIWLTNMRVCSDKQRVSFDR